MRNFLISIFIGIIFTSNANAFFKKKSWLIKNNWNQSIYWETCKAKHRGGSEEMFSPMHTCLKKMRHESKNKIKKELDAQYLLDNKNSGKEAKDNNTTKIKKISLIDQAKKTCLDLGFTAGTEKFAECSLKIVKLKSQ
jgi:hypothetical protein